MAVLKLIGRAFGPDAELLHDDSGRPYVKGSPLSISVSHSRSEAIVAVSASDSIGIDIEDWRPALRDTAHKWLTEHEASIFTSDLELLKAWTAKEAIFKAMPASRQPSGLKEVEYPNPHYSVSYFGSATTLIAVCRSRRPMDSAD